MPGPSLSHRLPALVVWLSFGLRGPGTATEGEERLKRVCPARSSGARLARPATGSSKEDGMGQVIIGMDPHKRSATIEV
ncbi:MAG: hypothetical protein WBH47_12115, partial [Streptosporangiaceae bacterium]